MAELTGPSLSRLKTEESDIKTVDVVIESQPSTSHSSDKKKDPAPCIAIVGRETSKMTVLNLQDGSSSSVKISDDQLQGVVNVENEVFAVTGDKVIKLHGDGSKMITQIGDLGHSQVVGFGKKIFFPKKDRILCFNLTDNSLNNTGIQRDLPVYGCCTASDDSIYLMGTSPRDGRKLARKYKPRTPVLEEIRPMNRQKLRGAAACLGEKIYVMGGSVGSYNRTTDTECYNPQSKSWSDVASMNVARRDFSAFVYNGEIYAIGGNPTEKENGIYEDSIEVYNKESDSWKLLCTFQSSDRHNFAYIWPHGPFHPDPRMIMLMNIGEAFKKAKDGHFVREKKTIGSEGGEIILPGCNIVFPPGAVQEDTEFHIVLRKIENRSIKQGDPPAITPELHCYPSMKFDKPVSITIRTYISTKVGSEIPVTLQTREQKWPLGHWVEEDVVSLGDKNEINFTVDHFSGMRGLADGADARFHLINDFYIHTTGMIAVVFCQDYRLYDLLKKLLAERDFANFALAPHEITGAFGSKVSLKLECKTPEESHASDGLPSSSFEVDDKFFEKDNHEIYYDINPEPPVSCPKVEMLYSCKVENEKEECLPLVKKWPIQETNKGREAIGLNFEGPGTTVKFIGSTIRVHAGDQGKATTKSSDETKDSSKELATGAVEEQGSDDTQVTGFDQMASSGVHDADQQASAQATIAQDDGEFERGAEDRHAHIAQELKRRIKTKSTQSKIIGPVGGSVKNFGWTVTFPAKEFDKATKVETSVITDFSDCPEDKISIAPIIECSLQGRLNRPALLEAEHWAFPTSDITPVFAEVFRKDIGDTDWQFVKKVRIIANQKISFTTKHFSLYDIVVDYATWLWTGLTRPLLQVALQNLVYINGVDQSIACVNCLKNDKVRNDAILFLKDAGYGRPLIAPEITHALRGGEVMIKIGCVQPPNLRLLPDNNVHGNAPGVMEVETVFPVHTILKKCAKYRYLSFKMVNANLMKFNGMLRFRYSHTATDDNVEHTTQLRWPIPGVVPTHQTTVPIYGNIRTNTIVGQDAQGDPPPQQ